MRALLLEKTDTGVTPVLREIDPAATPNPGTVWVDVWYSSLNYKDGLAVTGKGKIIRGAYPFVPGIDLVGQVAASDAPEYRVGDWVIGTGWGLGEDHWGGYATRQHVEADWLVPLPSGLTPLEAMALGTAGLTAMLSVMALEAHGITPDRGEVVVTGASGGVGSLSVALLAAHGYRAVASTGKADAHDYLHGLGAARVIDRRDLAAGPARPLDSARWAGGIDSVGGSTLAAVLSQTGWHGCVAACGLAASAELHTTVFPFILRGVSLAGIDSNTCPLPERRTAWTRLATQLPKDHLATLTQVIPLADVPAVSAEIVAGNVRGRVVVDVAEGGIGEGK